MYCDACGASLNAGARFCGGCGKVILGGTPAAAGSKPVATEDRVRRHIQPLAILWLVNGVLRLMEVGWMMIFGRLFLPGMGNWMRFGGWPFGWSPDSFLLRGLYAVGISLALFGVLHLVLAWGLMEREPWARMLGIVIGCLALVRFPLGTALGIYTLWVLAPENSKREFDRMSAAQMGTARVSS